MAILENRVKINNGAADFFKALQLIFKRFLIVVFVIFSLYLLYFSKPKQISTFTLEVTGNITSISLALYEEIFSPLLFLSEQLAYFNDLKAENLKLKLQLTKLSNLENTIGILRTENSALKNLLNVVPDEKYNHITARLLSVSLNPFSKTVLVGAGKKDGVDVNQIVSNERGLVGRITQVSDNYSRVMLINDFNSRIPIVTLLTHERGILTGNNANIKIVYLQKNHTVNKGEKVITSGDGMIYPGGIVIGEVSKVTEGEVLVKSSVDFDKTDFVHIFRPIFTSKEIEKIN